MSDEPLEVEELSTDLAPQTPLDSMIRDMFFRIIHQHHNGSVRISLEGKNTGTLRWEIVHHELMPGKPGGAEVTIWIED